MGYLLGIDLGSSSVKASLLDAATGVCVGSAFYPETEAPIAAPEAGFAEQNPADWYDHARSAIRDTMKQSGVDPADVKAIGIAYQMHGLVCTDASDLLGVTKQSGDLGNVFVAQFLAFAAEAFSHLLPHLAGVDQLNFAFAMFGLTVGHYPNVRTYPSVVEHIGRQTDDGFK